MVVISAAILSKSGKPLLSRQYVDTSRIRIEGLLSAFPKLVGTGPKSHTLVETDSVRYVYQPLESGLYLVVISTKSSNIVEDLETLRLLARLLPDLCKGFSENEVRKASFEILFAFDEVIVQGGNRESFSVDQIRMFLSMDSQEEKLANLIRESKELRAREEMKQKVKEIEANKVIGHAPRSMGSDRSSTSGHFAVSSSSSSGALSSSSSSSAYGSSKSSGGAGGKRSTGMQLGKKKTVDLADQLAREEGIAGSTSAGGASMVPGSGAASAAGNFAGGSEETEGVVVSAEEKVHVVLDKSGGMRGFSLSGDVFVTVSDPAKSNVRIISSFSNAQRAGLFAFKTHPKINKDLFAESSVLAMKDASSSGGFPVNTPLSILRWRQKASNLDDDALPVMVNVWVNPSPAGVDATVEFEARKFSSVRHLRVVFPVPAIAGNVNAAVQSEDTGGVNSKVRVTRDDNGNSFVEWMLPAVEAGSTGSVELTISGGAKTVDAYFPVRVSFDTPDLLSSLKVVDVIAVDSGRQVAFSAKSSLGVESYSIGE
eukprot:ANDGO_04268.mRNA.1 Coatomer subunit delta-1